MPLFRLMDKEPVSKVPYEAEYRAWVKALGPADHAAVMAEFDRLIQERVDTQDPDAQILTAGWLPGSDWSGTPWDPIYQKAARQDHVQAALCFGLLCWVAFMNRPERWIVGKFELDGRAIGSNTYFMARD